MATTKEQRVANTFDLLKRNQVEITNAIAELFEQAAVDFNLRRNLESFIEAIPNPHVRSAQLTAIRWFTAMKYQEREKATKKLSLRSAK